MNKETLKNILRGISLAAVVLFFCPQFLVSCSGQTMEISMADVTGGLQASGTTVTDPQPVVCILLLLPIVMLIISFIKNKERILAIQAVAFGIIMIIALLIIKSGATRTAEDYGCSLKTLWGYWLYMIVCIFKIVTGLLLTGSLTETGAVKMAAGGRMREPARSVGTLEKRICRGCGAALGESEQFCGNCGKKYEEQIQSQKVFCQSCGAENDGSAAFCAECGGKLR